jgi:hypothetical protein
LNDHVYCQQYTRTVLNMKLLEHLSSFEFLVIWQQLIGWCNLFAHRCVAALRVWSVWVSALDITLFWINLKDAIAYSTFSAIWMSSNLCTLRFFRRFSGSSCDGNNADADDGLLHIDADVDLFTWIDNKLKSNDCNNENENDLVVVIVADDEYCWYWIQNGWLFIMVYTQNAA